MINKIIDRVKPLNELLKNHPLYERIISKDDLCFFMERHVFAVLDFMSLLNALKRNLLPSNTLWTPPNNTNVSRFINEITLAEESDVNLDGTFISHFELYLEAMNEIGASTLLINQFIQIAKIEGIANALIKLNIPSSSKIFISDTFNLIEENATHKIAASFCFGREKSIPIMFQAILDKIGIKETNAPKFHYYIKRHIEIDGEEHGPMSENLLNSLCCNDVLKWEESSEIASASLKARNRFWDNIQVELSEYNLKSN